MNTDEQKIAEELAKEAALANEIDTRGVGNFSRTQARILTAIQTATAEYSSRSEIYLAELADAKAELETTKRELAESERSCELKKAFIEIALEQRDSAFKQLTKALSDLAETKAQLEQATQEIYQLRHACNTWQMKVNRVESELDQMRKKRDEEYPCAPPWLNGDVHQWPIKAQRNYFSWLSNQRIHEAANARKERDTAIAKLREAEAACAAWVKAWSTYRETEECTIARGGEFSNMEHLYQSKLNDSNAPGQSLLSELDRLRKLRAYTKHDKSCSINEGWDEPKCSCGLSALLEEKA